MTTLLESIIILDSYQNLPKPKLWIVGGDEEDVESLKSTILAIPRISKMYKQGLIHIWGHVEKEGLAEIYSRSFLTVVPSYFEQFGLIAPEAMACGCPVLGSDTGGLIDSILPCITGKRFTPGDSLQLATIISGYLRTPAIATFEGRNALVWSEKKFSNENIYRALGRVLEGNSIKGASNVSIEDYDDIVEENIKEITFRTYGENIQIIERVSGNSHVSFRANFRGREVHVKYFHDRPSSSSIYMTVPKSIANVSRRTTNVRKMKILGKAEFVPDVLLSIQDEGIVISEWIRNSQVNRKIPLQEVNQIILQIQSFGDTILHDGLKEIVIEEIKSTSLLEGQLNLDSYYSRMSSINLLLEGPNSSYVDSHPQIELFNIRKNLQEENYPLPLQKRTKFILSIDLTLNSFGFVISDLVLSHGIMKLEHFIENEAGLKVCDWESSGFRFGPADLASWFYKNEIGIVVGSLREVIIKSKEYIPTIENQILLVFWIQFLACQEYLTRYMRGQAYNEKKINIVLNSLSDAISYLKNAD